MGKATRQLVKYEKVRKFSCEILILTGGQTRHSEELQDWRDDGGIRDSVTL